MSPPPTPRSVCPTSSSITVLGPHRHKIYCDHWIHTGECAFTQVGCRYLHQMPTDRKTLTSLGLRDGPPAWWRRANQPVVRPPGHFSSTPTPASRGQQGTQVDWGHPGAPPSYYSDRQTVATTPVQDLGYGPIARPSPSVASGHCSKSGGVQVKNAANVREKDLIDEDDDILFMS